MPSPPPLPRPLTLWLTWASLILLTLVLLAAGDHPGARPLGLGALGVVMLAAAAKARQVMWHFLNLRQGPIAWKALFLVYLGLVAAMVLGGAMLGRAIAPGG